MKLFFDTSALVKFFHEEVGTERVTKLICSEKNEVWVLDLARVEFTSALFRKYRAKEISDVQLDSAIKAFYEEYQSLNVEPLSDMLTNEAERLLQAYGKKQGLRTLDALHLAAFLLLADEDWTFVACDKVLCKVAELEGYKTNNPALQ